MTSQPPVASPGLTRTARQRVARGLLTGFVVCAFLACGLVTLAVIGTDTGPVGLAVGVVFAALPVFVVVPAFLWLDRFEAEPTRLLLFAFFWGALVATLIAVVINTYSLSILRQSGGDVSAGAVFVAPLVEESAKGLAVLLVLLLRRREFDGVVDGIVYAGLAGIGFAFTENVLYLGRALTEGGGAGLATVFVIRCLFGPFAHPLFTMATGIGLGIASRARTVPARVLAAVAGWCLAVVLHGLWNLSAVAGLRGFVTAYVVLQIPLFLAAVGFALWARRREGRLIAEHVAIYAESGWLTPAEAAMLASMPERRRARSWARSRAGRSGERAMRAFQATGTELAFLRDRMSRGTAPADAPALERQLLEDMVAQRLATVGR